MRTNQIMKPVKTVFPFDWPFIILPLSTIAAILVLYAYFLIKLKPSKENVETNKNEPIMFERHEKPKMPAEVKEKVSENVIPAYPRHHVEVSQIEVGQTKPNKIEIGQIRPNKIEASTLNDKLRGAEKKIDKGADLKKPSFLSSERQFEGCPHKFGHLKSLRKNAPIPDECFGCSQILECLMTGKKS